jgi:hypothetical protein
MSGVLQETQTSVGRMGIPTQMSDRESQSRKRDLLQSNFVT